MICSNCKNEIKDDAKFCPFCGEKVQNIASSEPADGEVFIPTAKPIQQYLNAAANPVPNPQPIPQAVPQPAVQLQLAPQPIPEPVPQPAPQTAPQQIKKKRLPAGAIVGIVLGSVFLVLALGGVGIFLIVKNLVGKATTVISDNADNWIEESVGKNDIDLGPIGDLFGTGDDENDEPEIETLPDPEPEPTPYAEEYGLSFMGIGAEGTGTGIPRFYDLDEYNNSSDPQLVDVQGLEWTECSYLQKLTKAYKTKPDKNGNVKYYVEIYCRTIADYLDPEPTGVWMYDGLSYWAPHIFDYYSGYILNQYDYSDGFSEEYINTSYLERGDKEIVINTVKVNDGFYPEEYIFEYDNYKNGYSYHAQFGARTIVIIECPADYDGIVFAINDQDINKDEVNTPSPETKEDCERPYRRLFDLSPRGFTHSKDDYVYVKLSDVAESFDADKMAEFYSDRSFVQSYNFNWADDYYSGNPALLKDKITDPNLLSGNWECYMLWSNETTGEQYGEVYGYLDISGNADDFRMDLSYYDGRFGDSDEWTDMTDYGDVEFSGQFTSVGTAIATDPAQETLEIKGFYSNGIVQYAVGRLTAYGDDGADVFLFRP